MDQTHLWSENPYLLGLLEFVLMNLIWIQIISKKYKPKNKTIFCLKGLKNNEFQMKILVKPMEPVVILVQDSLGHDTIC